MIGIIIIGIIIISITIGGSVIVSLAAVCWPSLQAGL